MYNVKSNEFINDYEVLKQNKITALEADLTKVDEIVNIELARIVEEMREGVKEQVRQNIIKLNNEKFDPDINFYEKYLEEIVMPVEVLENVENVEGLENTAIIV